MAANQPRCTVPDRGTASAPTAEIAAHRPPPPDVIQDSHTETLALSDFRISGKIGAGTHGTVYRAHQISRNRTVALKVFAGDAARRPDFVARFAREASLLGRLDHPGIVRCYGVGGETEYHYFAMEWIDGVNAALWLQRCGGRLAPVDAVRLTSRCAEALAYAADRHVVHRDVKPGNILLGWGGDVKLADWGTVKPTNGGHALTGEHMVLGTLRYVAPEQIHDARQADHRSDQYALGGVLYELLTGRVPFPGGNWFEVLRAKEKGNVPPAREVNPAVPRAFDPVLARMLAPDPADRYPSYGHLLEDLRATGGESGGSDSTTLPQPPDTLAESTGARSGPRLQILLVYDEPEYVPLLQHALHSAGVPHDLNAVEDGHRAPAALVWDRRLGGSRPDVLVLGLTNPTRASAQLLSETRGSGQSEGVPVYGLSRSPDGAALLRALGLGVAIWVTGFGDLKPLGEALRAVHASAEHGANGG